MTDAERTANYICLKKHITMLETRPITEDRLQKYKWFFRRIRNAFPNLASGENADMQDVEIRMASIQGETYMQALEKEFEPAVYLHLLRILLFLIERTTDDEELADMMRSMGF